MTIHEKLDYLIENSINNGVIYDTFIFPNNGKSITLTLQKEFELFCTNGSNPSANTNVFYILYKPNNWECTNFPYMSISYLDNTITITNNGTTAMAGKTMTYCYC